MLTEVESRLIDDPAWAGHASKKWRWVHQSDPKARSAWDALLDPGATEQRGVSLLVPNHVAVGMDSLSGNLHY